MTRTLKHKHLHIASAIAAVAATLFLSSCSSDKALYSWHNYEDVAYQHYKKQTEKTEKRFEKEINKVIKKQKGTRKTVPPGIFAEYGFYLIKSGKEHDGLIFLNKELSTYPESETYISRIIKQIENNNEAD